MSIDHVISRLPFPLVRHVCSYAPALPKCSHIFWNVMHRHFFRRVCSRCGEFLIHYKVERPRIQCHCHVHMCRYTVARPLRVYLKPHILLSSKRVLNPDEYHTTTKIPVEHWVKKFLLTLPRTYVDLVTDSSRPWRVDEYHFILDRQPHSVFSFLPALTYIAVIEKYFSTTPRINRLFLEWMTLRCFEERINCRLYPIAIRYTPPSQPRTRKRRRRLNPAFLFSQYIFSSQNTHYCDHPLDDQHMVSENTNKDPSVVYWKSHVFQGSRGVSLPFHIPVTGIYPDLHDIRDVPLDFQDHVRDIFEKLVTTHTPTYSYDPLFLL